MKAVCHIGTPKTASTFLQNTCVLNRDWLARHGVLYPDLLAPDANHITLFYAAARYIHDFARDYGLHTAEDVAAFRDRLRQQLMQQIATAPSGTHTVLMSSENLTANITGPGGIQDFAAFLRPYFDEIEIVIYLRRQDDAILSMYGEYMKRGFSKATFDDFATRAMSENSTLPYIFYRRLLTQWASVFGRSAIRVRLFDRAEMPGGDVLTDFLQTVIGPDLDDLDAVRRSPDDNVGLSAPALEFLRRVNAYVPFRKDGALNPARVALDARLSGLPRLPRPQLSAAQSDRIMRRFDEGNDWVRQIFLPDRTKPLFPPREGLPAEGNLGRINVAQFAALTGEVLK